MAYPGRFAARALAAATRTTHFRMSPHKYTAPDFKAAEKEPAYKGPSSHGCGSPPAYDSGKCGLSTSPSTQGTSGSKNEFAAPYVANEDICQSLYINGTLVLGTFVQRKNPRWTSYHSFLVVGWTVWLIQYCKHFYTCWRMDPFSFVQHAFDTVRKGINFDEAFPFVDTETCDKWFRLSNTAYSQYNNDEGPLEDLKMEFTKFINGKRITHLISILQFCLALLKSLTILFLRPSRNYANFQWYFTFGSIALMALSGILSYVFAYEVSFNVMHAAILWIVYFPASVAMSDFTGSWARRWLPLYYEQVQVADGGIA